MFTKKLYSNIYTIKEIKMILTYAFLFLLFFYFFYGLSSFMVDENTNRFRVAFQWEKNIPFIPNAAWIYNSLAVQMLVSLFIIRDKSRIHLLFKIFCSQVLVACVFFLFFPIEKTFPPRYGYEELPWVFLLADMVNLKNNDFPSLHVCLAFTTAIISAFYLRAFYRLIAYLWAVVIALSTILIHEHHLVDIIGGVLLSAFGVWYFVRKQADLEYTDDDILNTS